jgi:uncharacterized protein
VVVNPLCLATSSGHRRKGPDAAKRTALSAAGAFYDYLFNQVETEAQSGRDRGHGFDPLLLRQFCVQEHRWTGTVPGAFTGLPGHGRQISFRLLHVFEFNVGLITPRENVWMDGAAIAAQL